MFTSILIGLLYYSVILLVVCIGWHRHCKMTEDYDRAMEEEGRTIAAAARLYPE